MEIYKKLSKEHKEDVLRRVMLKFIISLNQGKSIKEVENKTIKELAEEYLLNEIEEQV